MKRFFPARPDKYIKCAKTGKIIKVANYNYTPLVRRDNMNPATEGINGIGYYGILKSMRVPSKKHKNRYKNFIKMFGKFL